MKIRVCIVDDHIMVIEGLKTMLEGQGSMEVVSTFTSAEEYQEAEIECDVLLLDINLPGKNGIELCTELTKSKADVSVIGITNFGDTAFVKNMMRSGAKGYLLKNTAREELIDAIHQVQLGNVYLSDKIKNQLLND
ncbi:MAG: response regulator transcription factor, partial [Bacteroidota bacterium]